jgi:superfamily I DNA and/or RNA helicase
MAPFRGQVVLIRKLLRLKNLGAVDVGTVENYQAVERDVIVLSMTRSTHAFVESDMERRMGLFGQAKRSNVALTRAEHLLIVVGDPNTMAKDFVWSQFLWFCLRNGLWYGETGETESTFRWGSSHRIARHRPRFESEETSPSVEEGKPQVVTVSTMERLLRE